MLYFQIFNSWLPFPSGFPWNIFPIYFPYAQNWAITVDSEFPLYNLEHIFDHIHGRRLVLSLCFTKSQTQLPTNGTHHSVFHSIWNLGNSINNCFYLTACVIGHHDLSIILHNFILRTFLFCFSILNCIVPFQVLRTPYLDYCNKLPFLSQVWSLLWYFIFTSWIAFSQLPL